MYGFTLVFIQFFSIFLLFLSGPITPNNIVSWVIIPLGLLLGISAIWTMKKSKLRIFPQVSKQASLVTSGPYAFIRHPMYTAVLIVGAGMLLNDFSLTRLSIYLLLLGNQILKLRYEESMLENHFKDYKTYKSETYRLVPYLF